jgi:hypothetical protein
MKKSFAARRVPRKIGRDDEEEEDKAPQVAATQDQITDSSPII